MAGVPLPGVNETAADLRRFLAPTPLRRSAWLSEALRAEVFLKLDCVQPTGSFKVRGAFAKLLSVQQEATQEPLRAVAASTGNHGCAVAYALSRLGGEGTVFVPENASPTKVATMRRYGVNVKAVGTDGLEAEIAAREFSVREGIPYVSPYNDPVVVRGQASVAVEMLEQEPSLDCMVASVGGGGLIGGIGSWLAQAEQPVRLIGCSPANSSVMLDSVAAGEILEQASLPTLSDGTAGGVEAGAITFPLVRDLVDQWHTVDEDAIREAVVDCLEHERLVIEGAAGVAIAAALSLRSSLQGRSVGIVLCGANIDSALLKSLL